jgi:hypothetical protein
MVLSKHKNNNSKKKNFFFLSPTHFFFYSVPPVPYLFHPSYLPSVFLPVPFSPSSSFRRIHSTCALLVVLSAPSFLLSLLVSTPESRHHFSLSCTLSPQILWNFLYHTPLILPSFPSFFDSLPLFLLVRVFVPFIQLRIHPSSFCSQSFHFSTGAPVPLVEKLHRFQNKLFRFHF